MLKESKVTTRDFLRNFKKYKDMISEGEIDKIFITVGAEEFELTKKKKEGNGKEIAEFFRNLSKPVKIKRYPELFNIS